MIAGPQKALQRLAGVTLIGLCVGLLAAFATTGFVEAVRYLNDLLYVSSASRIGVEAGQLFVITAITLTVGGLVVGLVLRYGVESGKPAGPADTIFAVQLHERLPSPRSGLASSLAAVLSLGCGASVGQYAPLVYLGTLIGQLTSRLQLGLGNVRSIAISCGVAAAISTAFNTPIAALIFTHEVILRHYSPRMFTAVAVASASGYLVDNVIFERTPLILFALGGEFRGVELPLFALQGVACGLLAVMFMKLLAATRRLAAQSRLAAPLKPMLAGFLLSLVAWQIPEVLGAGEDVFRFAIRGSQFGGEELFLILVVKILVTAMCISFGFAGGVFFPSLLIGVLFGALFAHLVPMQLLGEYSGLPTYAVCGMAALMSPMIGAPMTALLLVFEITRSYEITVAAMLAIVFANLVAYKWHGRSLWDSELAEQGVDLSLGRERAYLQHQKAARLATAALPVFSSTLSAGQLRQELAAAATETAVIVDDDLKYLGQVSQTALDGIDDGAPVTTVGYRRETPFDESTSIWEAMQLMRDYIGLAIPVVESKSGRYLGAVPESAVIRAYLDATHELRREEHEA
jgi:CIC family chloride channel protein